jgi:hypothetical protein
LKGGRGGSGEGRKREGRQRGEARGEAEGLKGRGGRGVKGVGRRRGEVKGHSWDQMHVSGISKFIFFPHFCRPPNRSQIHEI